MRKSHCCKIAGLAVLIAMSTMASAQTIPTNNTPIIVPSSSSSFNQNGFNLPTQPSVHGQDVVRGTSGISCHSAIGSGGPSLDMGVIGSNDIYDRNSVAVYGRVSVPLGKRPKRVDCTRLYELEVQRLEMELEIARSGAYPTMLDPYAASQALKQPAVPPSPVVPAVDEEVAMAKQQAIVVGAPQ